VITGREPGAPGFTPDPEFTHRQGSAGGTGHEAVDLREIQRSEDLISHLAAVCAGAAGVSGEPLLGAGADPVAVALLALAADVAVPRPDVAGPTVAVPGPEGQDQLAPRRAARSRRRPGRARQPAHGRPAQGMAAWLRAAAAGAVVAGLAATTSLIAASMLARLYRVAGVRDARARGWGSQARHRRYR
jgi:hypothetical protein